MKLPNLWRQSLTMQMVLTQVGLVVLTAAAIGLPALWLLRAQLDRHAWQMLDQGGYMVQALLDQRRSDLENLALLTAQRPTLQQLAASGELRPLADYLDELQSGAGLDLLVLCSPDGRPVIQAGESLAAAACAQADGPGSFLFDAPDARRTGWLFAGRRLADEPGGMRVIAGQALDDGYARTLHDQVGLELALVQEGELLGSSFTNGEAYRQALGASLRQADPQPFWPRQAYYRLETQDPRNRLGLTIFFPSGETAATRHELTVWVVGVSLAAVLLSSALGVLRARQISQPLWRLRAAADRLRKGDLATPITLRSSVREASQAAYALEAARSALQHSLQQLQGEKAWVEHLLEAVVEGILTLDRRGRISFFSQGAERITGWPAGQVLGCSADEVFKVVDEPVLFSQRIPAPGGRRKMVVQLDGGRTATLSVTGARLAPPEAGKGSVVLVLRDVSDEESIRRLLGEFLANIAHEFRTPLSALAASIELLLDQLPTLEPDELAELLNSTHLGVLNLQTLIDNLLEGASIETGRFRVFPRPAGLDEIFQQAGQTMAPLAKKYGQAIRVELPEDLPAVQADPRRTGQVLVNLLSNAVKWGPAGGVIQLAARLEGGQVLVSVADEGPGLPEGSSSNLFLRFDRAHARQGRGESGAGLGLYVVKAIVEAQGGQVGARNAAGRGAVFWFTLPLATAAPLDERIEEGEDVQR